MKTCFLILFTLGCLVAFRPAGAMSAPADSIGMRTINNQNFIVHKVNQGETLSAIARRYEVTLAEVRKSNPTMNDDIQVGSLILVPFYGRKSPARVEKRVYAVKKGENLYRIGQMFNMTVDELVSLNKLSSPNVREGQELVVMVPSSRREAALASERPAEAAKEFEVVASNQRVPKMHTVKTGEYLFKLAKDMSLSPDSLRKWNNLQNDQMFIGQDIIVGYKYFSPDGKLIRETGSKLGYYLPFEPLSADEPAAAPAETAVTEPASAVDSSIYQAAAEPPMPDFMKPAVEATEASPQASASPVPSPTPGKPGFTLTTVNSPVPTNKRISGVGAKIPPKESSGKNFLALHATAPYGTFIKATNPSNGKSTVVKVIGAIPESVSGREQLVIMLSEAACEQIGILNDRFPIQLDYNE